MKAQTPTYLTMLIRQLDAQIADLTILSEELGSCPTATVVSTHTQKTAIAKAIFKAREYREELQWLKIAGHGIIEDSFEYLRSSSH